MESRGVIASPQGQAREKLPSPEKPLRRRPVPRRGVLALVLGIAVFLAAQGFGRLLDLADTASIRQPGDHVWGDTAVRHAARDVEFQTYGRGSDRLIVWDWGSEDGDVVKVAGQEIELRNAPAVLPLPLEPTTTVEVLGVKDGGGGITVGVSVPGARPSVRIMALRPGQVGHIKIR